jgi:fido (protein-threonine AMPylation protein)
MLYFFLFPRLKSIMKGARFADVAAIQERVTAVLRSIPKYAFADIFQNIYESCQQRLQAPDQGSTVDFNLFPRPKGIMKGARFADVAAIQVRVTAVLRSIPKEAFANSFQKLYESCQQCVVKDGNYFEGQ